MKQLLRLRVAEDKHLAVAAYETGSPSGINLLPAKTTQFSPGNIETSREGLNTKKKKKSTSESGKDRFEMLRYCLSISLFFSIDKHTVLLNIKFPTFGKIYYESVYMTTLIQFFSLSLSLYLSFGIRLLSTLMRLSSL